jgi:predicted HD phosphohydrolase
MFRAKRDPAHEADSTAQSMRCAPLQRGHARKRCYTFRDGAAEETIFAALFHDVADRIAPINHARVGAEILRPYVGEETYWVLAHHSVFQGYYYWHHVGRDRNEREKYRGHPHFEACAAFCEQWDQRSFDRAYDTMPLEAFLPAVRRMFAREPYSRRS